MTTTYYLNEKYGFVYSGIQQEQDRIATVEEVDYWNKYNSILPKDRNNKLEENTKKYAEALNKPIPVTNGFVIADWMTTYSNTYTLAKKYEEEGIEVSANIVILNAKGLLETVIITSLAQFEEYYNAVANEWTRCIDLRNKYMVEIQNSVSPKEIEIKY